MNLTNILPLLLAQKQQEQPQSAFNLFGMGPQMQGQTPPIASLPQAQNMPAPMPTPVGDPSSDLGDALHAVTPMEQFKKKLQERAVWQSLLMGGASALDGNPLTKTALLGFGTYDKIKGDEAASEQAGFKRDLAIRKEKREQEGHLSDMEKNRAAIDLDKRKLESQDLEDEATQAETALKKAQAKKARASAAKLLREAKKAVNKDSGKFDEDRMHNMALKNGFVDELSGEASIKDALNSSAFYRDYNHGLDDEQKVYKRMERSEIKEILGFAKDPDDVYYDKSAEEIIADLNLEGVYSPKDIETLTKRMTATVKQREKQKKNPPKTKEETPRTISVKSAAEIQRDKRKQLTEQMTHGNPAPIPTVPYHQILNNKYKPAL